MKYSKEFERDFKWFLSVRHMFSFDGALGYDKQTVTVHKVREFVDPSKQKLVVEKNLVFSMNKQSFDKIYSDVKVPGTIKGSMATWVLDIESEPIIVYDPDGVDGKQAFHHYDSTGMVLPTRHPNILRCMLKTKGSVNLHIKMFAEDKAKGRYPGLELRAFCIKYKCPPWFKQAILNQTQQYHDKEFQHTDPEKPGQYGGNRKAVQVNDQWIRSMEDLSRIIRK